jgi:hypothetical protein
MKAQRLRRMIATDEDEPAEFASPEPGSEGVELENPFAAVEPDSEPNAPEPVRHPSPANRRRRRRP